MTAVGCEVRRDEDVEQRKTGHHDQDKGQELRGGGVSGQVERNGDHAYDCHDSSEDSSRAACMRDDGPMWLRGGSHGQWVVDVDRLGRDQQVATCRSVLELVVSEASRFQCDVPWDRCEDWPEDVQEAATELVPVHSGYQVTGWVDEFSQSAWRAFVTFAPYAYDSDVWTSHGKFLAEVNDEGSSLTVHLRPEQAHAFAQSNRGAAVVPLRTWQQSRRQSA